MCPRFTFIGPGRLICYTVRFSKSRMLFSEERLVWWRELGMFRSWPKRTLLASLCRRLGPPPPPPRRYFSKWLARTGR
jgi:hypothetical protein